MNDQVETLHVVFQSPGRKEALESQLVLDAANIPNSLFHDEAHWQLGVAPQYTQLALDELQAYGREKREAASERKPTPPRLPGSEVGLLFYASTVMLIGYLSVVGAFGMDWYESGSMRASRVNAGEWWRCFTALTLHTDSGHLASNLLFGTLFGFFAGQALGGGVAWLVILLGGALGNAMNAWVQPGEHVSIGASTAVFSALGLMVVYALRPSGNNLREKDLRAHFKRWSPLVGGVALLGLLGVGDERTDVVAHVTGFLAGLIVGWLGCRLPVAWLKDSRLQFAAAGLSLLLLIISWLSASFHQ